MDSNVMQIKPIARIRTDFSEKFGIPRQSGIVAELSARIVFEPDYRDPEALRGIEGFDHLWLIWGFSANRNNDWRATVRPPRLGGNVRMGVFATRSPYRPNPLGLSCVKFVGVEQTESEGSVIIVSGADMLDNTPIYDIKPYIPYADSHPDAKGGFAANKPAESLRVEIPDELLSKLPEQKRGSLVSVLAQDPRPAYQNDPERIYGLCFAGFDLHFKVNGDVLTVLDLSHGSK
ncbi:MAG: tRNA (N6-threonylcarbamoyladenosine(37)-N6)-methyltransferase TrmO [Oscillospiraceae bacterium]|nr:tRNA (N6-threonylcarbamoyladenosine(37)-N6)-methyltransferase TrmO [Oscillospiraceae bacterium]